MEWTKKSQVNVSSILGFKHYNIYDFVLNKTIIYFVLFLNNVIFSSFWIIFPPGKNYVTV